MTPYTPIQQPQAPVRFRRPLLFLGAALGMGILAFALWAVDDPKATGQTPAPATTLKPQLSGVIGDLPASYHDLPADEPPASSALAPQDTAQAPASEPPAQDTKAAKAAAQPASKEPRREAAAARHEPPKRWLIAKAEARKPPFARPKDVETKEADQGLLKPAKWVRPLHPELVLNPGQAIPVIMLQALNSDTPGMLRLMVTQDVVDIQTGTTTLIPQFSTILGAWKDRPKYGDTRADIKVQSLRLYGTGTLVDLTGGVVGGRGGASGVEATVDNHVLQTLAAIGASAVLSMGSRIPGGNTQGYNQTLGQEFAQDAGSQMNRAGQRIVEREVMRPPTLTQAAGYPLIVQLADAISFQQPPKRSAKG